MEPITILTPVYLDRPERLAYLQTTLRSFYQCCQYPGPFSHYLVDDRSPFFAKELRELCEQYDIRHLGRTDPKTRRGFFEVFRWLLSTVKTEFFLYLEPDHYFYLPGDFLSPILKLFAQVPDLVGVYLRAPMTLERFKLVGEQLITMDNNQLDRHTIDEANTGWLGRGYQHEGFSLMPTLWRTQPLQEYFLREGFWLDVPTPYELEFQVDHDWFRHPRLMGYLNAQAFSYHIGQTGGMGGGHTFPRNTQYEEVWSSKIL
ncbi:MAG: hypothetical protein U0796_02120 [Gemmatales bacterium]